MKQHLYVTLIEDFCRLTGLPSADSLLRGGTVETEGIRFSLTYLSRVDPDLLFIYCDFMTPPPGYELDGYRALLTKNLFLYTRDAPVFALSPDTGHVVLAQYMVLDGLRATALADKLIQLAITVRELRKDLFRPAEKPSKDARERHPAMPTSALFAAKDRRIAARV